MFGRVYLEMRLTQLPSEHALRRFRVQSYGSTKLVAEIVVEGRGLWGWALGASGFGFKAFAVWSYVLVSLGLAVRMTCCCLRIC